MGLHSSFLSVSVPVALQRYPSILSLSLTSWCVSHVSCSLPRCIGVHLAKAAVASACFSGGSLIRQQFDNAVPCSGNTTHPEYNLTVLTVTSHKRRETLSHAAHSDDGHFASVGRTPLLSMLHETV